MTNINLVFSKWIEVLSSDLIMAIFGLIIGFWIVRKYLDIFKF